MPIFPGNAGDLPRLGLGLWRTPEASIAVEAVIILTGTYLYYRAATEIARRANNGSEKRARWLSALILGAGIVTLTVDASMS